MICRSSSSPGSGRGPAHAWKTIKKLISSRGRDITRRVPSFLLPDVLPLVQIPPLYTIYFRSRLHLAFYAIRSDADEDIEDPGFNSTWR